MEWMVIIALMLLVLAVGLAHRAYTNHRHSEKWVEFAAAYDLVYFAEEPAMAGVFEGMRVRISVEDRQSGDERLDFTLFEVDLTGHVPSDLTLLRQGIIQSIYKLFGGQDIQVGHADFDDAFMVKGHDEAAIVSWLQDAQIREAFLQAQAFNSSVCLKHGTLTSELSEIHSDHEKLLGEIRSLIAVGRLCCQSQQIETSHVDRSRQLDSTYDSAW